MTKAETEKNQSASAREEEGRIHLSHELCRDIERQSLRFPDISPESITEHFVRCTLLPVSISRKPEDNERKALEEKRPEDSGKGTSSQVAAHLPPGRTEKAEKWCLRKERRPGKVEEEDRDITTSGEGGRTIEANVREECERAERRIRERYVKKSGEGSENENGRNPLM